MEHDIWSLEASKIILNSPGKFVELQRSLKCSQNFKEIWEGLGDLWQALNYPKKL